MSTQFEVKPGEQFMMEWYKPDDLVNGCILTSENDSTELWIMLREDSAIFVKMHDAMVRTINYFAFYNDDEANSFYDFVERVKNGTTAGNLTEHITELFSELQEDTPDWESMS